MSVASAYAPFVLVGIGLVWSIAQLSAGLPFDGLVTLVLCFVVMRLNTDRVYRYFNETERGDRT